MIRKNGYQLRIDSRLKSSKQDCSSTDDSDSPRTYQLPIVGRSYSKEKLQLCRKFMEYGHCPYRNNCKFAHGFHELRKNNQKNSLYKTKQCTIFFREGYCHYGDRCNFLHKRKYPRSEHQKRKMKMNFGDLMKQLSVASKLLTILG